MKRILRGVLLNVILMLVLTSTTNVFAAYTSIHAATKAAVTASSGNSINSYASASSLPEAYSAYGFGSIGNKQNTFYGGATGGTNPYQQYWKNKLREGANDKVYVGTYTTGRTVSTAPSSSENHSYWACYPAAGKYNNTTIDVKAQVLDYKARDTNAVMSFSRSISVSALGIDWIKVKWTFTQSNGACTGSAVNVKGHTTYWDVDNQQGVMFYDSSNRGIYVSDKKNNKLLYKNVSWKSGNTTYTKPFVYTNDGGDCDSSNRNYAFTEIFEGASLTRIYSFYESDGNSNGGIEHSNKSIVCRANTCRDVSCGCDQGKTCWY